MMLRKLLLENSNRDFVENHLLRSTQKKYTYKIFCLFTFITVILQSRKQLKIGGFSTRCYSHSLLLFVPLWHFQEYC